MNLSRSIKTVLALGLLGALAGIVLVAIFIYPGTSPDAGTGAATGSAASADQNAGSGGNADAGNTGSSGGTVDEQQARQIAVRHLGEGRTTWIGREDEHGARWEVEVTRPDGSEADVYVASDGKVTHVRQKGPGDEAVARQAGGQQPQQPEARQQAVPAQPIDANKAAEIAASHVGGTADTVNREADSDYGAAWDVDVYSPSGEYTIYVSATGEIVRVEGPFRD